MNDQSTCHKSTILLFWEYGKVGLALLTDVRIECSAKRNRGVNEAFTEAARVALSVKATNPSSKKGSCNMM